MNKTLYQKVLDLAKVEHKSITEIILKEISNFQTHPANLSLDKIFLKSTPIEKQKLYFNHMTELVNILIYTLFDNARKIKRILSYPSTDPSHLQLESA